LEFLGLETADTKSGVLGCAKLRLSIASSALLGDG